MRKQNRCSQHSQQIVALCVDSACTQAVKAVCPLQLYNDHLDHKFENIAKIHSDWSLNAGDVEVVQANISRETMTKYMDSIIEELLLKVKEHLFLVRKELDLKMGVYFTSNPVQKIKNALSGLHKCINERFLDLKHDQIENAKFFVEIYGIKKLVNDTMTQKNNFQKEILIAFAKIKEEMFMDYPKFNALVKAKEYQYCEIIKSQKTQISVLKEQLTKTTTNFSQLTEQRKQLVYELGRTANQLKTKDIVLQQTSSKLKILTTKYNEQAQEAIMKAREIKTKNILGTHKSKNLFRISDRVLKTGDKETEWPGFCDIGVPEGKIFVKLNRFDVGSWVLIGIMNKKLIEKNQYEFDNYKTTGHGCYLLDNNRWCYSDSDEKHNCKSLGFEFGQGDIIKVQTFDNVIRFSKMVYGWEEDKFQLPFVKTEDNQQVYCVAVKGEHTEIALV